VSDEILCVIREVTRDDDSFEYIFTRHLTVEWISTVARQLTLLTAR